MHTPLTLFWFRRDLRLHDNAGLYHALKSGNPVLPVFIFDNEILDKLEDKKDRRVEFIHKAIGELQTQLTQLGSTLIVNMASPQRSGNSFRMNTTLPKSILITITNPTPLPATKQSVSF